MKITLAGTNLGFKEGEGQKQSPNHVQGQSPEKVSWEQCHLEAEVFYCS